MSPQGGTQTRVPVSGWWWGSVRASGDSPGLGGWYLPGAPLSWAWVVGLLRWALGGCWVGIGVMAQPEGSLESLSPPLPETRLPRKGSPPWMRTLRPMGGRGRAQPTWPPAPPSAAPRAGGGSAARHSLPPASAQLRPKHLPGPSAPPPPPPEPSSLWGQGRPRLGQHWRRGAGRPSLGTFQGGGEGRAGTRRGGTWGRSSGKFREG